MYAAAVAVASLAFTTGALAAPSPLLSARQASCGATSFPWFINPQSDTTCDVQGTPQQASGDEPGNTVVCGSLQGSWVAAATNLDNSAACGYPFTLSFFTTTDCSDAPVNTTSTECLVAPGAPFVAFSATPN